jgi:hypothetical protein
MLLFCIVYVDRVLVYHDPRARTPRASDDGQAGNGGLTSSLSLSGVAMPDDLKAAVNGVNKPPQPAVNKSQLHRLSSGRISASMLPGATVGRCRLTLSNHVESAWNRALETKI